LVIRRNHKTGEVSLDPLRWGLIAYWCEDPKGGRKPINTKCETVSTLPSFREAYRKRRCLLPVDGFFEWKSVTVAIHKGENHAPGEGSHHTAVPYHAVFPRAVAHHASFRQASLSGLAMASSLSSEASSMPFAAPLACDPSVCFL
jgi:SOS response associated peptidase (SRAP)